MATNYAELDQNSAVIQAFKKQYDAAKARGDTSGMTTANQGAEAERAKAGYSGGATGAAYSSIESPAYGQMSSQAFGTAPTAAPSAVPDNMSYLQQLNNAKQNANIRALRQQYDESVSNLNMQEAKLAPVYAAQRTGASNNMVQDKLAYNETAAATGLNSGVGGQAELARQNNYARTVSGINTAESTARAEFATRRQQLKSGLAASISAAVQSGNAALAEQQYNELIRQQELLASQEMVALQAAQEADQMAMKLAADKANNLAKYGVFSGYEALGYSPEEIAAMQSGYKTNQAKSGGSIKPEEKNIIDKMLAYGDDTRALAYLYSQSFTIEKMGEIATLYQKAKSSAPSYSTTIYNDHGDGWVNVMGMGKVSEDELERLISSGSVQEVYHPEIDALAYMRVDGGK